MVGAVRRAAADLFSRPAFYWALAAVFAVTINVQTGQPLIGAILFPVGFCMLYLLGFDLLTGVFVLTPLALIDKRPGVTLGGVLKNWGLVFVGNFAGAFTVAFVLRTFAFDMFALPLLPLSPLHPAASAASARLATSAANFFMMMISPVENFLSSSCSDGRRGASP